MKDDRDDRDDQDESDGAHQDALEDAWARLEAGDLAGARRRAEALRARAPELADGAFLLASCLRAEAAESGDDAAGDQILKLLAEAARLDPEWAEPEMVAADWLAAGGDPRAALPHAIAAVDRAEEEEEFLDAIALKASIELDLEDEAAAKKTLAVLPDPKAVEVMPETATELGHLFLAVDAVEPARAWFERAAELAPEVPDVFHGLGLAAELAGDEEGKRKAWLRTLSLDAAIDDETPARMSEAEVAEIAEAALEELPPRARQLLANVPILIADRPARADVETGLDPRLLGVFSGTSLPDASSVGGTPRLTQIVLFQRNLERATEDDDDLRDEIRTTLLHETGHFFGMTEDDLDHVGLG